jgi:murein DD-endopeptidase MepM/ murein hydrolase activator NlpD
MSSFKSGLVSSAVSMTSTFTTGALGQANLQIWNDALNGDTFNVEGIQKLNSLTGNLVGAGLNYAMTGEATLNVLNLSDLTGGKLSSGLLELHLGGEKGVSMNIGSGGTDISMGTIAGAMNGLGDSTKVIGAKIDNLMGDNRGLSTLETINMLGWTGEGYEQWLAKAIWNDIIKARYEELGTDKDGEILGRYVQGSSEILLDNSLLGGGKEGSAKLAAVMSHEGTHLNENRYEGIAHLQGSSTYNMINAIFGLEEDGEFSGQMISAILNPESWVANTGDVDNWILMKDGTLVKDKDGWLKDANGMYINEDGSRSWEVTDKTIGAKGIETGLLNIIYGGTSNVDYTNFSDSQIEKVQALLTNSGFVHSEGAMRDISWKEGNDGAYIPFANIVNEGFGASVADDVFMNGYDELTNAMLFDAMLNNVNAGWMYDSYAGTILFGGNTAGMPYGFGFMFGGGNLQNTPDYVAGRLTDYFNTKLNFYDELRQVFLPGQLNSLHMTGLFGEDKYYTDDQHKGIDIGKDDPNMDVNIYSLFSGKVKYNDETKSAGNTVVISYGFKFGKSFYDTGIEAQFMHLTEKSGLKVNQLVDGATLVGVMGNTGDSKGPHLHYQLMSPIDYRGAEAKGFDMYNSRRDVFLNYIGAPDTRSYVISNYDPNGDNTDKVFVTTSYENFWSTQYNRYHYNVNNLLKRLGINIK